MITLLFYHKVEKMGRGRRQIPASNFFRKIQFTSAYFLYIISYAVFAPVLLPPAGEPDRKGAPHPSSAMRGTADAACPKGMAIRKENLIRHPPCGGRRMPPSPEGKAIRKENLIRHPPCGGRRMPPSPEGKAIRKEIGKCWNLKNIKPSSTGPSPLWSCCRAL
jgi:hypothetical protein